MKRLLALFRTYAAVILLCFVFLPFRLHHITYPITDSFHFRQTQTATFAQNIYKNGRVFPTSLDIFGTGKEKFLLLEFPLYEAAVAGLYAVFSPSVLWGRVVSIIAGFIGAIFLYRLVWVLTGYRKIGLYAAFFYLASPLSMFYQRAFMIDSAIITCLIIGLYYGASWIMEGGRMNFLLACLFLVLGFLQKGLYGPFWLLPLAGLYGGKMRNSRSKILQPKRFIPFLFLILIPLGLLFAWQAYVNAFNNAHGHVFFTTTDAGHLEWNFGLLSDRLSTGMWEQRGRQLLNGLLLKPGVVLFVTGLFIFRSVRRGSFFILWLLSQIVYFLVLFRIQAQNYYQLVMVPAVSVILGMGLWYWEMAVVHFVRNKGKKKLSQIFGAAFSAVFCAVFLWRAWISTLPSFYIDWDWLARIKRIGEITRSSESGIFAVPGNDWNSVYTFYSGRVMKQVGVEKVTPETIVQWKQEGYSFLVLDDMEKYPAYIQEVSPSHSLDFLRKFRLLSTDREFTVYKL